MDKRRVNNRFKQAQLTIAVLLCMVLALTLLNCVSFTDKNSAEAYATDATPASLGSLTFSNYDTRSGKPFDGTILDKLYGAIYSGQGGVSTTTATYDQAYAKVKGSSSTVTGSLDAGYDANWIQPNSMDFRTLSGGAGALTQGGGTAPNPITVEFGGFKWNVVYATTNTTDSGGSGDLIATLWMSEASANTYAWSYFSSTDMTGTYTSAEYSTSRVRVETLNAGGATDIKYATTISKREGVVQNGGKQGNRENNQFAQFTLPSTYVKADSTAFGQKSLTQYLEPVSNLEYQRAENYIWAYNSGSVYLNPNEAWGTPDLTVKNGGKSGYDSNTKPTTEKNDYSEWINDLLWLPSTTEIGFSHNSYKCVSLWGIPNLHDIVKSSDTILSRTEDFPTTNQLLGIQSSGILSIHSATTTAAIRPALHLNLTKAEQNCARSLAVPQTVTTPYNMGRQDMDNITTPSWYKPNKMTITYTNTNMINADSYKATAVLTTTDPTECWSDGTSDPKEFNFVITKKDIEVEFKGPEGSVPTVDFKAGSIIRGDTAPTITLQFKKKGTIALLPRPSSPGTYVAIASIPDDCNYNLTGDTEYEFRLELHKVKIPQLSALTANFTGTPHDFLLTDFEGDYVDIESSMSGVTVDKANSKLTITDAGTYEITAKLIDELSNNWDSGVDDEYLPRVIGTIIISPAVANVSIADENGDTQLQYEITDSPTMEIIVNTLGSEKVKVNIYAKPVSGSGKFLVASNVVVDGPSAFNLNLTGLSVGSKYNLTAELTNENDEKNRNYTLVATSNPEIEVLANSKPAQILWRLTHGKKKISFNAGENASATYTDTLTYDEQEFSWTVDANRLALNSYAVDTTYGTGGYINSAKTDAGTYTTSVRIKSTVVGGTDPGIFEITWTIDKAQFNLSKVKWKGNGTLEYNGQIQEMLLENLPARLVPIYSGTDSHKDVTTSPLHVEVASLDFVNSADSNNYYLPDVSDLTSYVGNVVWDIDWNIIPKKINVQWGKEVVVDANENKFNLAILRNKEQYPVVTHTYYKSDGKGNKVGGPISESSIVVPKSGVDYYICEISLSDTAGYELLGNIVREFEVAYQGEAVTFTPNTLTFTYSGSARTPQFTNSAKLSADKYKISYYTVAGAALTSAPINVGVYRVEIQLNNDLAENYFIGGNSDWEFEIVTCVIADDWNLNAKPPRMNINKTELNMIEYEFADENGNVISWDDVKSQAGNYKIRAKIKTQYSGSCTFTDGALMTDWVDFELTAQDLSQLQDPTDPTLYPDEVIPTNPDEPGNPNNPPSKDDNNENNFDFGKVGEIIKQWWQVVASVISIILIVIFVSKVHISKPTRICMKSYPFCWFKKKK
ncbi:MAG: hypothetical protein K2M75_07225, partial [Clostridia bacterium]|nr:hypothetical protein [Clostridia bacterium]